MKVSKGPQNVSQVGDLRVTVGATFNGRVFQYSDFWKALKEPDLRVEPFVGETHFIDVGDSAPRVSTE